MIGTVTAPIRLVFGQGVEIALGTIIVVTFLILAAFAPFIAPYDPDFLNLGASLKPPSAEHWFGTDMLGRDVFSRVVFATRIDLLMGTVGVLLPMILGSTAGLIAGYGWGWVDALIMRLVDVVLAFPWLILMMAIIAVYSPGLVSFFFAVTMVGWVSYARLVRARVRVVKRADYVKSARVLGYGHARILTRHILPNAMVPALVFAASDFVLVLTAGSAVSYLGMGVQPPTAEWGLMIAEGRNFITTAWWIPFFPGMAIVLLAFGFSLIADGLSLKLGVGDA